MAQKDEDRRVNYIAELLLKTVGISNASVGRGTPPEPDVVVTLSNGKLVGMELTSLDMPPGDNSHAIEPALRLLCDTARELHRASGAPAVQAVFTWKIGVGAPAKKRTPELAKILVKIVQGCAPLKSDHFGKYTPGPQDDPFIREFLLSIMIRLCDEPTSQPRWASQSGAGITYAPLTSMQSTVARKKSKPAGYRTPYSETWLVVHNGFESIHTHRDLTDAVKTHEFETPYDRLFYVPAVDEILELVRKPPAPPK